MSFTKAIDLLCFAKVATSRQSGEGLCENEEEVGIDNRTAWRIIWVLEEVLDNCAT